MVGEGRSVDAMGTADSIELSSARRDTASSSQHGSARFVNLSSEDELRLNVLLANARAVRIDESRLAVFGLSDAGELSLQLNPIGSPDAYAQSVRAYLSTHVLGSPKHYPTHLRRWAGLGQFNNAPLDKLLLLGDPEAVFAVACSPRLTVDLAESAWWSVQEPAIARALLKNSTVAAAAIGNALANWMFEYLPFEENAEALFEAVCLLLRPGLIDFERRRRMWEKGRRNKIYRAAFLASCPHDLPDVAGERRIPAVRSDLLGQAARRGCTHAMWLTESLSASTQAFLWTCRDILMHASQPFEVITVFESMQKFLSFPESGNRECVPVEWAAEAQALMVLAQARGSDLTGVFARSDAVGSVMRAQTNSITAPVLSALAVLVGE